ncbi:hypothetical protein V496_01525 [Pseudogymnoascus sp. VKM F-4515 (FW-2607)]|nr:hypothetical protein V496_01525 [Pseudogymnoascus sp. VKM F-4515 (FW-2607)]
MSGLLGNVTKSVDNTLTGGDDEQGKGGLLGGVTNTVRKTVDSAGNVIEQTVDGAGNIVGQTTQGVADTAGKTTQGVGNVAGGATNTASGLVGGEAAQGAADESAPARPRSAYVIFSNKMREDLKGYHLQKSSSW